jgi:hypothetical protein
MPNAEVEEALAELEKIGWPCRLAELPGKYDQLARENERLRKSGILNARKAVIDNAVRWCNNILVEVMGNHGRVLSDEQRDCIRTATQALGDFPRKG